MTTFTKHNRDSHETQEVIERLLHCLPSASIEMETLIRLTGIETTRKIPTAAVECVAFPKMLINPDFVKNHCKTNEHLFLLIMHELWHVMLAHTRLYPRPTQAHNIAFDAIINAQLSRQFSAPEFRGFFERLNKADEFPSCLLRPPLGYPTHPEYPQVGPEGTSAIMYRLYPPIGAEVKPPLYEEILQLLRQHEQEKGQQNQSGEREPFLLGDHDSMNEESIVDNPAMGELIKKVAESSPKDGTVAGSGTQLQHLNSAIEKVTPQQRRVFLNVLRTCLNPRNGQLNRSSKYKVPGINGISVILNPRDRLNSAREIMGVQGMLYNQPGQIRARTNDRPAVGFIYLDVSASMREYLPPLIGLTLPFIARGYAKAYQFSTVVEPVTYNNLKQGIYQSTLGTRIDPVLEHLLEAKPSIKKAILITDGHTGHARNQLIEQIKQRRIKLYVILTGENASKNNLENVAHQFITLKNV